jgi:hypothetical protein
MTPRRTSGAQISPIRGTLLLMGVITACELAMLSVIFWARAQGNIEGLVLAVIWPWAVGIGAPVLWSQAPRLSPHLPRRHRLVTGGALALVFGLALTELISIA